MSHLSVATSVGLQNVLKTAGEKNVTWTTVKTVGFYDLWHTSTKVTMLQKENCAVKMDYGVFFFFY